MLWCCKRNDIFHFFSSEKVKTVITRVKPGKVAGLDGINAKFLKANNAGSAHPVHCRSLRLCVGTDAKAILIPKSGKPKIFLQSYHPKSLFPPLNDFKVVSEAVPVSTLTLPFQVQPPFMVHPSRVFGFRRGHSISQLLVMLINSTNMCPGFTRTSHPQIA